MDSSSPSISGAWPTEEEPLYEMIMVMGVTGAGKSYFINKIAGVDSTNESHKLAAG
jgi:predicted GTPase